VSARGAAGATDTTRTITRTISRRTVLKAEALSSERRCPAPGRRAPGPEEARYGGGGGAEPEPIPRLYPGAPPGMATTETLPGDVVQIDTILVDLIPIE
jgi:hypothetical protein